MQCCKKCNYKMRRRVDIKLKLFGSLRLDTGILYKTQWCIRTITNEQYHGYDFVGGDDQVICPRETTNCRECSMRVNTVQTFNTDTDTIPCHIEDHFEHRLFLHGILNCFVQSFYHQNVYDHGQDDECINCPGQCDTTVSWKRTYTAQSLMNNAIAMILLEAMIKLSVQGRL